ncbi:MAG: glycosyltransferase family 4 protein [Balneolaceae bacterium]|nr:glycosyltransferase family 4 protein [Balneolaceae bacterium]
MKKILYIASTLKRTGPNNQLLNIVKHLDRDRFEPYVITLSPEEKDSIWKDYEALGVTLYALGLSRIKGVYFARRRLQALIDDIIPDLIHSQGIRPDMVSSVLRTSAPKLCTVRNFPQVDYKMTYGQFRAFMMIRQHIIAMKKMDLCVGVSESVIDNLTGNFGVEKTKVIPNGVDTDIYKYVDFNVKVQRRNILGLPENADIWLSVGHLSERKNPLLLIESWKKAFGDNPQQYLIFVGDGPLMAECAKAIESIKNIKLVGRVEGVKDYLEAGDYFISSSRAEGLPNTVLEALSCGLPVILSNIEPHREILSRSMQVGRLFDINRPDDLALLLSEFTQENRIAMSEMSRCLATKVFSAKNMSKGYQSTYSHLIDGAPL